MENFGFKPVRKYLKNRIMREKITKKNYSRIIIMIITFIIGFAIFSDWDNFKEGIMSAFN